MEKNLRMFLGKVFQAPEGTGRVLRNFVLFFISSTIQPILPFLHQSMTLDEKFVEIDIVFGYRFFFESNFSNFCDIIKKKNHTMCERACGRLSKRGDPVFLGHPSNISIE